MQKGRGKLVWGAVLVALGYLVLVHSRLGDLIHGGSHAGHSAGLAESSGQWEATLMFALALVEILIAVFPLRRGERWALGAALAPVAVVGIPRVMSDPRCLTTILSQHGCHTFMISMTLVTVGVLVAAFGSARS